MQNPTGQRSPSPLDPNLFVLPALRAPIDEGRFIPHPPRNRWDRLLLVVCLVLVAAAVLAYAFLRATALR